MKSIKIVHTSDLHLGATFSALGEKSKLHRIDCQNVLSRIVDLCIKERANALLIAGDLFDTPGPQKSLVKCAANELERLKGEGIAFSFHLEIMTRIKREAYGWKISFLLM